MVPGAGIEPALCFQNPRGMSPAHQKSSRSRGAASELAHQNYLMLRGFRSCPVRARADFKGRFLQGFHACGDPEPGKDWRCHLEVGLRLDSLPGKEIHVSRRREGPFTKADLDQGQSPVVCSKSLSYFYNNLAQNFNRIL